MNRTQKTKLICEKVESWNLKGNSFYFYDWETYTNRLNTQLLHLLRNFRQGAKGWQRPTVCWRQVYQDKLLKLLAILQEIALYVPFKLHLTQPFGHFNNQRFHISKWSKLTFSHFCGCTAVYHICKKIIFL